MTEPKTDGEARPERQERPVPERAETAGAPREAAEAHGRGPSRAELTALVEQLQKDLDEAHRRAQDNLQSWQRSAADFANYKRRMEEERDTVVRFANAALIGKLLGVLDDFDRALENVPPEAHDAWIEGVKLVERKLRGVLEAEGVKPIEAVGQPFDPNLHEAVVHEETADHPDNQVIGELQKGYLLHDRLLRPALVRVANNPKEQ
ncbi:MAG TPA: nucleotide exchange factor GrpE [candidate division Zixibacteria bacterium]|nr:nucleotide exchange factor GrpE [candidate division Zixibacteria bacterium]